MRIESDRFGTIDVDDGDEIRFPEGLIGFFNEHSFVLCRHRPDSPIGWLQSTTSPWLALPVVSIEALAYDFDAASLDTPDFSANTHSVMVVLHANAERGATVNLMAPIVINTNTREGRQTIALGGQVLPFALRRAPSAVAA
jgi:flagellar assembly factor FliW